MSTDHQTMQQAAKNNGHAKLIQYDEYINRQVESTRRLVKMVDLATALVALAAGVLIFLMTAAVVEHWLVPNGFPIAMRAILFAILAAGVVYFAYRRLWPLCIRAINPVYAAQAIEQTGPTLKNSLINLLLFRERRSQISDAVYQTLEEQAAQRLSRVPIEGAVDQSLLIRFGYMLVAIVAVAAIYKVLSPKDPIVAAQRVLMPWADIVPASRVKIDGIEPGAVTVSRGEFVNVSAEVRGIDDDDEVLIRFTTEDGRALDKPLVMKPSSDGLKFEARLPQATESADTTGIAQNLRYRIEAGDARSLDYAVTVVEAPSILVERVEYDYPAYTGHVDRAVDGIGDIRAIEGTRVTIHARANGAIGEAHIDFDADGRRDTGMNVNDALADASFVLALREDRQTPRHASYVLRFENMQGRPNNNPVKHSIAVEPDNAPVATILSPKEQSRDVRLDETVMIDVEAHDADFGLSGVRLQAEVAGRSVVDEPLLAREQKGRFTGRHAFTPQAHKLRAGDIVTYWVVANDNRTPQPNSVKSERQQLRIVSPDPAQQPPPDRMAQRDRNQRQQPGGQQDEQQPQDGQQQGEGGEQGKDGEQGEGDQQQPGGAGGQGEGGENQQPQDGGQQGGEGQQQGEQVSRDAQGSEQQGEGQESGQGGKQTGQQGGKNGEQQNGGGDAPARQTNDANQSGSQDKQTGAGAAGSEPTQGSQPDGPQSENNPARPQQGGPQNDGQQKPNEQQPNSEQSPVSNEGDNDGEAFERIQKHLERSGELKDGESSASDTDVSRDAQRSAAQKDAAQSGEQAADRGEGTGADAKGDDVGQQQQPNGEKNEQTKSLGGEQTSSKGPAGAGEEQEQQGAPNSQPEMKPGDKRQQSPSQRGESDQQEPPAGAHGKKESDSQGEQGGDRAGGGEEGGGQQAPREGTGSAGQNQSADEGAGESKEQGAGKDSSSAGADKKADDQTGQAGDEAGKSGQRREGEGQKPGGAPGETDKETGRQGDKESNKQPDPARDSQQPFSRDAQRSADGESQSKSDNQGETGHQGGTAADGGGQAGALSNPSETDGTAPAGDDANLEYTRKQTDLVLGKLAEQLNKKKVDKKLLDDLGWTEDDLQKFVARWKARKEAANRNDPSGDAARRELDEALRSLGLRQGPIQQARVKEDSLRDLREGYRGAVPLEYQERLRAYNQGVSRAQQDGE